MTLDLDPNGAERKMTEARTFDEKVVRAKDVAEKLRETADMHLSARIVAISGDVCLEAADLLDFFQTYAKTARVLAGAK